MSDTITKSNERNAALRRAALRRSGSSGIHRRSFNRSSSKRQSINASLREA